jgi:DNA-binding transcriptional ArsR family regulator
VATATLDATFLALSDPTRRAMVTRLASGPASVNELAEPFDMSLQAVSKHLKVLERAGLVTRERAGQQRPARLSAPALQEASRWLVDFRSFFIDGYERLDDLLEQHHPERKQP